MEDCVIVLSEMADYNSSDNETDASGYESDPNKGTVENDHCSDWDEVLNNEWSYDTGEFLHNSISLEVKLP